MTALRNACDDSQTLLDITNRLFDEEDPLPVSYTIGSETISVLAGGPATITVVRGFAGTTAASHAAGTAINAVSGGAVPDPSTGVDGDVPQVSSGAYVLASPSGGPQTVNAVEVVVAFSDDLVGGKTLVALTAGEQVLLVAVFLESAVTATQDTYLLDLRVGAEVVCSGFPVSTSYQTFSASIGQAVVGVLPTRGVTIVVKTAAGSSGTWTAGSIRLVALVASAA